MAVQIEQQMTRNNIYFRTNIKDMQIWHNYDSYHCVTTFHSSLIASFRYISKYYCYSSFVVDATSIHLRCFIYIKLTRSQFLTQVTACFLYSFTTYKSDWKGMASQLRSSVWSMRFTIHEIYSNTLLNRFLESLRKLEKRFLVKR